MAYGPNELVSEASDFPVQLRAVAGPDGIMPKTFAAVSGGGTLAPLTPVAYNTSTNKWVQWSTGGANGTGTVKGFVWPDAVVLDDSDGDNNDVLGQVMTHGVIHFDDIPVVGGTEAQLKTALQSGLRELGFTIQGLENFR